jgi:hypothetical protein
MDIESGNGAFDGTFFLVEGAGVVFWIVAIFCLRRPRRFFWPLAIVAAATLAVAVPAVFTFAFPARGGIEGAGRILFCGMSLLPNALLSTFWAALFAARSNRKPLRPALLFVSFAAIGYALLFL